jgi:hypothetical protein
MICLDPILQNELLRDSKQTRVRPQESRQPPNGSKTFSEFVSGKVSRRQFKLNQSTMAIIHEELNGKVHIKWIIKEHKFPSRLFFVLASSSKNCN